MLAFSARISGIFWLTSIGRQYSNAADNRSIIVCICVFHPNDNRNLSTERSIPIRPNSPLHMIIPGSMAMLQAWDVAISGVVWVDKR